MGTTKIPRAALIAVAAWCASASAAASEIRTVGVAPMNVEFQRTFNIQSDKGFGAAFAREIAPAVDEQLRTSGRTPVTLPAGPRFERALEAFREASLGIEAHVPGIAANRQTLAAETKRLAAESGVDAILFLRAGGILYKRPTATPQHMLEIALLDGRTGEVVWAAGGFFDFSSLSAGPAAVGDLFSTFPVLVVPVEPQIAADAPPAEEAGVVPEPVEPGEDVEPLPTVETPIEVDASAFAPPPSRGARWAGKGTSTGWPHAPIYFDFGVGVCAKCEAPIQPGALTIAVGAQRTLSPTSDWTPYVAVGGELVFIPFTEAGDFAVQVRAGMKVPRASIYLTGGPIFAGEKEVASYVGVGINSYDAFTVWPRTAWLVPLPSVVEVGVVSPPNRPGQLSFDGPVRVKVAWGF